MDRNFDDPSIERITELVTKIILYDKDLVHIHTMATRDSTRQGILDLYTLISSLPGSKAYDEAEARFEAMK
ncbi:hypothetical protein BNJ_00193 [Kaumoebavirus]|uniref:hypothetical protein n=1 Tax=Kaumoebavirus TaxID=1859492 RepID=UPI0009C3195C|nr:hypothetical protein BNJ_00193 [Kaumoebavirus]ARA72024.1 hypothetical protein BNJ_00193 [Kaumoebavirus]